MSTPDTPNAAAVEAESADPTAVPADAVPADLQDERLIASQGVGRLGDGHVGTPAQR